MSVAKSINTKYSIREIWLYTYFHMRSRFDNKERDILPTKIKIINRLVYKKDRLNMFDEKLDIISYSAPQYLPYTKIKSKDAKKQMKIKHKYDIVIQLEKDINGEFSFDSKIRWRVGSFKKVKKAPQNQIKTIYKETKEKLEIRLQKKYKEKSKYKEELKKELDKIKKNGKYLDNGDWVSQVLGINLDCYYRDFTIQHTNGCLYGPLMEVVNTDEKILMPFFDKHMIGVLEFLMRKNIIKVHKLL